MRFILNFILLFFILLILIEKAIISTIHFFRKRYRIIKKKSKEKISVIKSFNSKTKHKLIIPFFRQTKRSLAKLHLPFLKRRHRKKATVVTYPLLGKIKYFFLGIVFSFLFLFLPLVFMIFLGDLPSPRELSMHQAAQTTKIFDRNNILLAEIYTSQNRTVIPLKDIPDSLRKATIAIEDKNFYKHPGFDIPSIVRAVRETMLKRSIQGGSTITQQLIKSSLLTPERSISRKLKELVLAFYAERIYTKDQILEMYFNQVPYGGMAWGVEAAAESYFDKPVKDLSLAQSAFLAGLTSAPSIYSPYGTSPQAWKSRQKEVLQRMVSLHFITQKQANAAMKETLHFKGQRRAINAPHFVSYVKDQLINKYGLAAVEKGGLQVKTSLDLNVQKMAEKVVKEEVDNETYLNLTNGAAVITDPKNGDILAMVGSKDFSDPDYGQVNLATSLRQPGSSIKVVTYAAALSNGYTAASILDDSPVTYDFSGERYSPVNYDGKFHGKVPLRLALANSFNIPAIKLLDAIGIPTMINLGKEMGITSWGDPKDYGLPVTLGAGEVTMLDMAKVYGTLANGGVYQDLNPILKVTTSTGTTYEQKKETTGSQVLSKGVAFIMSDILADNQARSIEFGTNSPLMIPNHTVSVKTGTTDNKRDNWTDGYTDKYTVIVWVGNNDNSPMSQSLASGITGAAPIWNKIMTNLLTMKPETKPVAPEQVVQKMCFGRFEYFLTGTENSVNCGFTPPGRSYSIR